MPHTSESAPPNITNKWQNKLLIEWFPHNILLTAELQGLDPEINGRRKTQIGKANGWPSQTKRTHALATTYVVLQLHRRFIFKHVKLDYREYVGLEFT